MCDRPNGRVVRYGWMRYSAVLGILNLNSNVISLSEKKTVPSGVISANSLGTAVACGLSMLIIHNNKYDINYLHSVCRTAKRKSRRRRARFVRREKKENTIIHRNCDVPTRVLLWRCCWNKIWLSTQMYRDRAEGERCTNVANWHDRINGIIII